MPTLRSLLALALAAGGLAACDKQPTAVDLPREPLNPPPAHTGNALPTGPLLLDTLISVPVHPTAEGYQVLLPAGRFNEAVEIVVSPQWNRAGWEEPLYSLGSLGTWGGGCYEIIWSLKQGNQSQRASGSASRSPAPRTGGPIGRAPARWRSLESRTRALTPPTGARRSMDPGSCVAPEIWIDKLTFATAWLSFNTADGAESLNEDWEGDPGLSNRVFTATAAQAAAGMRMDYYPYEDEDSGSPAQICDYTYENCVSLNAGDPWNLSTPQVRVRVYGLAPLACAPVPVQRGETVTCRVNVPGTTVQQWKFTNGQSGSAVQIDAPAGGSLPLEWAGPAVISGTVTATVVVNGQSQPITGSYTVRPRDWLWRYWDYLEGWAKGLTEADDPRIIEPQLGLPVLYGWNCDYPDCTKRWVQPDIAVDGPETGYTVEEVTQGPNAGYWFVKTAQYQIRRASRLNPYILPHAPTREISGSQAGDCISNGMPETTPGKVEVNFYTFNKVCKGIDMDAMLVAAWAHEGYGTNHNNGHQSVAEIFAGKPENDPHMGVEPLWEKTRAALVTEAAAIVRRRQTRIDERAGDHAYVKNNYSHRLWMWDPSTNEYVFTSNNVEF